jgi:hypothetical protein
MLFVIQKSARSGSLFLSGGQHVGSPVDWVFQVVEFHCLRISHIMLRSFVCASYCCNPPEQIRAFIFLVNSAL